MSEMTIRLKVNELQSEIGRTINDAFEEGKAVGRAEAIEEIIKTLADNEDTILTDKQYYTLEQLKEQI